MIEFVVREGHVFEAVIMDKEKNNPDYRWAFFVCFAAHWLCVGLVSDLVLCLFSFAYSLLSQVSFWQQKPRSRVLSLEAVLHPAGMFTRHGLFLPGVYLEFTHFMGNKCRSSDDLNTRQISKQCLGIFSFAPDAFLPTVDCFLSFFLSFFFLIQSLQYASQRKQHNHGNRQGRNPNCLLCSKIQI